MREGKLTTPQNRQGTTTWREWLEGDGGPVDRLKVLEASG